jgi:MFS family permease
MPPPPRNTSKRDTRGPAGAAAGSGTRASFLVVAHALFVMLLASNLPTPLYAVYSRKFGFSDVELTLIFVTYAIVLMPSLIVFGQLSDRFGRRPVIAAGLAGAGLSLALFAAAQGTLWLFVGRGIQGFATGVLTAAASAALAELEPSGHPGRAAVATVAGTNGGSAAGPLLAGALAQWAPWPLVLCYLVTIAAVVVALVRAMSIEDPVVPSGKWVLQRPSVPAPVRGPFARAALSGATVWAAGGLFLSLVPSYAGALLHTGNLALLGAITALMLAVSAAAQLVLLRAGIEPTDSQPLGLVMLVGGLGILVLALPLHSVVAVLTAAVLSGAGLGTALFGAQTEINRLAPPRRRGEVTAAFIACLYGGVTVVSVATGLLADSYGLSEAITVASAALAAVGVGTIVWHLAVRRSRLATAT